jgi:hypothetical protein
MELKDLEKYTIINYNIYLLFYFSSSSKTKLSKNDVFMPEDSTIYLAKKDVVIKEVSVNNT